MPQPRLADRVVTALATEIVSGRRVHGSMLPTEQQLCQQFDVSRTVIRDATARLARCGLLQVRQGLGSVIRDPVDWNEFDPELIEIRVSQGLIGDLAQDLLRIRLLIEVDAVGEAARRRDDAHLRQIAALFDEIHERLGSPAAYIETDIAFHDAIIAASGNRLLGQLMRPVNQIRRIASTISLEADQFVLARSIQGHQEIFDAIVARDVEAAREAMARHVKQFAWMVEKGLAASGRAGGDHLTSSAAERAIRFASGAGAALVEERERS